jgi:hypothetical protein
MLQPMAWERWSQVTIYAKPRVVACVCLMRGVPPRNSYRAYIPSSEWRQDERSCEAHPATQTTSQTQGWITTVDALFVFQTDNPPRENLQFPEKTLAIPRSMRKTIPPGGNPLL